jgi:hypothetical protein
VLLESTTWEQARLMKRIASFAKWKRTTMPKVLVKHAIGVQKPWPKVRQVAMHVFQASTKRQRALIVPLDNLRTILIRQVVPNAHLDIMPKTLVKFRMSKENATTDVQDVLVASMVLVKNRSTKKPVVLIVVPVDFQI